LLAGPAGSTTTCDRYASPNGSDDEPGTIDAPFQTVGKLVHALAPGQTGCLLGYPQGSPPSAAGFYEEDPVTIDVPGITLRSADGQVAQIKAGLTIAAAGVTVAHLVLDGRNPQGAASPRIDADHVTLAHSNVTTRNTADCVTVAGAAQQVVISHNRIHDCERGAQLMDAHYALVADNLVYDNTAAGIKLAPASDGAYLTHNIIDGNGRGILWGSGVLPGESATSTSDDNVAVGNIVSNSKNHNVTAVWHDPDGSGPADPVPGSTNAFFSNCIHHATLPGGGVDPAVTSAGWNPQRIWTSGNAAGDPRYADASRGDFALREGSPCPATTGDMSVATADDGTGSDDHRPDDLAAVNQRPNVLIIMTDDQRADGTVIDGVMSDTRDWFKRGTSSGAPGGTEFTEAFTTTPICCPSRSSVFTGQYVHNHQVSENDVAPPPSMDPDNPVYQIQPHTLQRYLRDRAGYRTGLFGKFLNSWRFSTAVIMPNFDDFGYFQGEPHCPFSVMEDPGVVSTLGSEPLPDPLRCAVQSANDYSTTWIGQEGRRFIEESEQTADAQPWLLYLTPAAPHDDNMTNRPVPEEQYSAAAVPPADGLVGSAGFQEGLREPGNQLTDKPQSVQNWRPPCDAGQALIDCDDEWTAARVQEREAQLRTLMSIDDMVQSVFTELEQTGEADDTLAFFISDNGYMWGEHGVAGKGRVYLESLKIPFYLRWPDNPIVARNATNSGRLAANIDVAPTVFDALDITPDHTLDGRSLLDPGASRAGLLAEFFRAGVTRWRSLIGPSYQYTEYVGSVDDGFREYYRFPADLAQLTNLLGDEDPADPPADEVQPLAAALESSRGCTGSDCP
jgi:arylsulfatase A-like enzyme